MMDRYIEAADRIENIIDQYGYVGTLRRIGRC